MISNSLVSPPATCPFQSQLEKVQTGPEHILSFPCGASKYVNVSESKVTFTSHSVMSSSGLRFRSALNPPFHSSFMVKQPASSSVGASVVVASSLLVTPTSSEVVGASVVVGAAVVVGATASSHRSNSWPVFFVFDC